MKYDLFKVTMGYDNEINESVSFMLVGAIPSTSTSQVRREFEKRYGGDLRTGSYVKSVRRVKEIDSLDGKKLAISLIE